MKRIRRAYSKTVSIIDETAVEIYESFVGDKVGFLLESYDKEYDRYVFMGKEPEEVISSEKNRLVIRYKDGSSMRLEGNPVDLLKAYYSEFEIRMDEVELAFRGGLVGALGYDFVRYKEELPDENPDEIGIDAINLMLITEFIAIDHQAETLTAVVIEEDNPDGQTRATGRCQEMIEEAFAYKNSVVGNDKKDAIDRNSKKETEAHREMSASMDEKVSGKADDGFVPDGRIIKKSDSLEEYSEKVEKIKHYIREGHVFQTVLSQRWTIETGQKGIELYKRLRDLNPSPYMYYFRYEDFEVIGSSPEMIVQQQDNLVKTCPIAGTRPRGKTVEEDLAHEKSLMNDPKEKAEHVMLVDLARNDMGRIAEFGTVKVRDFMHIQRYSHVMHIVSFVEGRKKGKYHPVDLLDAFLPAGTLSGAPKVRAMEIIDELENVKRGLYGGAVGYIDFNGNLNFCITIRTMVKKGNRVYLQAGAGIVADSDPVSEYNECCNKVRALAKVLVQEENL